MINNNNLPFIKNFSIISCLIAVGCISLNLTHLDEHIKIFAWISFVFLCVITFISLYIGFTGDDSKSLNKFITKMYSIFLIKIVASILLIISFLLIAKPTNNKFIIPFLVIYLIYTVYETRTKAINTSKN